MVCIKRKVYRALRRLSFQKISFSIDIHKYFLRAINIQKCQIKINLDL